MFISTFERACWHVRPLMSAVVPHIHEARESACSRQRRVVLAAA